MIITLNIFDIIDKNKYDEINIHDLNSLLFSK